MAGRTVGGKPTYSKFQSSQVESSTIIKTGSGILHSLTFSSLTGGGTFDVTIRDSGVTLVNAVGTETANRTLIFDCEFSTNLNINSDGQMITVTYI